MVAAALRKVCDALEQVFTKFSMDAFKGLRVKQLPAVVLVVASPTSSEIECHEWGWMSDRQLMPHLEHLVKNAYVVGQLQAPAPQVRVIARKQQADDIQRPEAESYFVNPKESRAIGLADGPRACPAEHVRHCGAVRTAYVQ
ncbi:hypothetical protein VOLCADRAFT_105508 [Volvox carteri f. nagariensis]|uniref:Uncharacterized protein n=1 Tax=Volvox carteri f. nagariensis TaxID=3068 RepID=D8U1B0_VOLCA|nr:uncharacterized protein VOLCADRAFT_105508 [Volvox carteri f. nagariensis]EFJ46525.1 hypothetical protein VOLCADRAFT_105508 [Volvox carteri f. nagariensis]|eukprot:XP_002952382.1 hypothetical protein VOLCADRAFT_105508 [Volvox carteri f. nagariensis]